MDEKEQAMWDALDQERMDSFHGKTNRDPYEERSWFRYMASAKRQGIGFIEAKLSWNGTDETYT